MQLRELSKGMKTAYSGSDVRRRVRFFNRWMDRKAEEEATRRGYDHTETVNEFYDLCSNMMVYGWGESLHFAPLSPMESLEDSIIRHQRLMIAKLKLSKGMTLIDVGCGTGGPMRRLVQESGVRVVGINISKVQLDMAKSLNAAEGIAHMVDYKACSFMDMSTIENDTFDGGYAIESTCHAPDKKGAFAEIHRVLKPGSLFWGQEMCMTEKFNPKDKGHQAIKRDLMQGVALKEIATMSEVGQALEAAGFEIIEARDRSVEKDRPTTPWYQPMDTRHGTKGSFLRRIPLGRKLHIHICRLAEMVGVFPKGSTEVFRLMDRTAKAYVAGGRAGIFTPLYCFLARKPL